eukprot:TRINITY_DN108129_c0_g1_i1.p3 TRINITY_DN108129_c0_g1~~TRINITY_DN108129_c0_g1_i1.p3  ORF type:complete len:129 (+),score=18.51 TRINITY_DN108129_c0_g1_i1:180-566(+)
MLVGAADRCVMMTSDEAVGRVWRYPTYYEGHYDKKCLVQCAIVEVFREIKPPREVPRDEVVAGGSVRDIRKLRQRAAVGRGAKRHSTVPPGRSAERNQTELVDKQLKPPPGPKPARMRPRSTSAVHKQ